MTDLNALYKLHKVENDEGRQGQLRKLVAEDEASQAKAREALLVQRAQDGQVSIRCKCGAESVLDAKRPEKGPKAKCGLCGTELVQ